MILSNKVFVFNLILRCRSKEIGTRKSRDLSINGSTQKSIKRKQTFELKDKTIKLMKKERILEILKERERLEQDKCIIKKICVALISY